MMVLSKLIVMNSVLEDKKYMKFLKQTYHGKFKIEARDEQSKFIFGCIPFVNKNVTLHATYPVNKASDIVFIEASLVENGIAFESLMGNGIRFISTEMFVEMRKKNAEVVKCAKAN